MTSHSNSVTQNFKEFILTNFVLKKEKKGNVIFVFHAIDHEFIDIRNVNQSFTFRIISLLFLALHIISILSASVGRF